jgi:hypothetical protein
VSLSGCQSRPSLKQTSHGICARRSWGQTAIEYLGISDDDQARTIVKPYSSLKSATERKAVTIDYLVMAAGADVHHVWGVIQEEVSRISGIKMNRLASRVVLDALIKAALKPDGVKAQKLLLKSVNHSGKRVLNPP